MKRKISALFVMTLFILSLVPATLAQSTESDAAVDKNVVKRAAVKDGRIVHVKDEKSRHARTLKLREASNERGRSTIKANLASLRDVKGELDGERGKKAMTVVQHAMDTIETMSIHFERLKERIQNSQELQDKYPNAISRVDKILDELGSMYADLDGVIADGTITGEEWRGTVLPILKQIKPKADNLRNNKDFKDVRGQYVRDFVQKLKNEVIPIARARHLSRGLSEAEADSRIARINTELEGFEASSREQQLARLSRIRAAMA
jgi:hypothetical protein